MIGVFDSGSGGLTVLAAAARMMPDHDFLYLGDHARAPYGEKSEDDITRFTREGVERLFDAGCDLVVLACNTASAVALRHLQENWLEAHHPTKRLLGVTVPMVEALTGLKWERDITSTNTAPTHHVGVFATRRTVESGTFERQIKMRAPGYHISQVACHGLAKAIDDDAPLADLAAIVDGCVAELLAQAHPNVVILGCTHYPLVEHLFRKALPRGVRLLSQPDIVAVSLKDYLARHTRLDKRVLPGERKIICMTSGNPEKLRPPYELVGGDLPDFTSLEALSPIKA